jgi:uncharacterized phage protein gp47/JayE
MPLSRPTLKDLVDRVVTDIESRLPGSDARLRRSNLAVLARVIAAAAHGLYGFLVNIARQVIIDTADGDYLERWAAIWGIARTVAVAAAGEVSVTGTTGAVVPAGTELQRSDGARFVSTAEATLIAGAATLSVQASEPGAAGNTAAGSQLLLTTAIAGVASATVVLGDGLIGGADTESDDALRARLLFRIRRPPQGGAASDYEAWAKEVPGVTRVWVFPLYLGAGTVGVFFVRDNDPDLIPDAGEVTAVADYIEPRRPVTAAVTVLAPTPLPVDFTLQVIPDTAAVRAAVEAELEDLFRREASPGGTVLISRIREAISIAAGENDHVLTAPVANVAAGPGEMAVLGAITWA